MSLLLFTKLFISHYWKMILTVVIFSMLPLVITKNLTIGLLILKFQFIFFMGLLFSFILHEYLHLIFLKQINPEGKVEIEFSFMKIALYPRFIIKPREMIKVAILPLILLATIGVILLL